MDLVVKLYSNISPRIKQSLTIGVIVTFFVHLFMLTNGLLNKDSMYNFYATQDMSNSGRFTLTYLAGITSYFDLHYFNGIISVLYIALTIALLIELFDIKSKLSIVIFSLLYAAFPAVSGTLAYLFTADGYFLANLLVVLAIYVVAKMNRKVVATVIAACFIYVAIGGYQANLAFVITLVILLFIRDILVNNKVNMKRYAYMMTSVVLGLLFYVIHFKIYDMSNDLTSYKGINEAGNISLHSLLDATSSSLKETIKFLFNRLQFEHLFEKLNVVYFLLFALFVVMIIVMKRISIKNIVLLFIAFAMLPFALHCIYFLSPKVDYHILMKQNIALLYGFGLILLEILRSQKTVIVQALSLGFLSVMVLVGFNFAIITNIYYEKMEDTNKQTQALMTQIAYDIRKVNQYSEEQKLLIIGNPSTHLSVNNRYDASTPINVGANSTIVYDINTMYYYLSNEVGLKNKIKSYSKDFKEAHADQISELDVWPSVHSIKVIEDTIVINFGDE